MFIQDARGKFNPIETLEMLNKYPISTLCAPPTAYRMLVLDERQRPLEKRRDFLFLAGPRLEPNDQACGDHACAPCCRASFRRDSQLPLSGSCPRAR